MTSHRERVARLRRSLWQPLRAHGEQPRERVVGPLELFYDLAVVALVAQAARHLAGNLTWRGLGEFAAVFTLVWIAWVNGTLHHELHGHEDARGRNTFLVQILVLVAMGAFIPEAGGARSAPFAVASAVLFAVLAVLWLLAARGDRPEYRRSSRLFVIGTAACSVLLAGTALLPVNARVPSWGMLDAAYLAGFAAFVGTALPEQLAALKVTDALIERFGLLTIIVLGETVRGVVDGLTGEPISALTLSVGLAAVVVGFGAWWTYFDFAGHRQPRPTRGAGLQWMLGHLPLTAAIAAMGAAMVSLVHDARTPTSTAWVLSAGAALVLCTATLLSASLQDWYRDRALYRPLALTCAIVAIACLGRRRRAADTAHFRPRAHPAARHPLGARRRAPPGRRDGSTDRVGQFPSCIPALDQGAFTRGSCRCGTPRRATDATELGGALVAPAAWSSRTKPTTSRTDRAVSGFARSAKPNARPSRSPLEPGARVPCATYLSSRKPIAACVPSQNGLFLEAPHRHSVMRLRTSYFVPSAAVTAIRPRTQIGPETCSPGSSTRPIDGSSSCSNAVRLRRFQATSRPEGQSSASCTARAAAS